MPEGGTVVVIDGTSVLTAISWTIAIVAWSYILGTLLFHLMVNWWKIERWVAAKWENIPLVADIRRRRQQEAWNWWWATRTPEQMAEFHRAVERTNVEMRRMNEAFASFGLSVSEATEAFSAFSAVAEQVDWSEVREYEARTTLPSVAP